MAGQFTLDISKFVAKAKINPALVVKKVIFDLYTKVVYRTPVDTGRARGGWQVGPEISGGDPGRLDKAGAGLDADKVASLNLAKDGVVGYIYNNVAYIQPLEYGHSKDKAPNGMVRITLAEFQQFVDKAVAELP